MSVRNKLRNINVAIIGFLCCVCVVIRNFCIWYVIIISQSGRYNRRSQSDRSQSNMTGIQCLNRRAVLWLQLKNIRQNLTLWNSLVERYEIIFRHCSNKKVTWRLKIFTQLPAILVRSAVWRSKRSSSLSRVRSYFVRYFFFSWFALCFVSVSYVYCKWRCKWIVAAQSYYTYLPYS